VILEESQENLNSVEDLDPVNIENNCGDENEEIDTNGKYFKVVKTRYQNPNQNFMNTGNSMSTEQLDILRNTLERSKSGKLTKQDLD
jgi:hypothetical protein